jgi:hypothetical protein
LRQGLAALRDFGPANDRSGSNSVIAVVSAARPLFHQKRKSICGLAMSQKCQKATNRIAAIDGLFDHLISGDHLR